MSRFVCLAALLLACSLTPFGQQAQAQEPPVFGIITDIQYADKDTAGDRHYRTTLKKLEECVADLSDRDLAFVIQLGDIVDGHGKDVKKSVDDLDRVLSVFNKLPMAKHHVVGNHCLSVDKETLGAKLGLKCFYYDFTVPSAKGWRFVVLDGNDAGYGVIGDEQLAWFRSTLDNAVRAEQKVICFCHFALLKEAAKHHRMAKPEPILKAMDETGCVVAWFAGHDHAGGYAQRNGVHHVTLKGMVEAPVNNAYAVIELHEDGLVEVGIGKEPSRELALSPPHANAAWWLRRAEQFAKDPESVDAHDDLLIEIARCRALSGDLAQLWTLEQRLKDKSRAESRLPMMAYLLVFDGQTEEADEVVAHLDSDAERQSAIQHMAWAFAKRHEFDRAMELASKVESIEWRNAVFERIAEAQAESGRWDEALATVDKIVILEDSEYQSQDEQKESIAKLALRIAGHKAEKVARPPEKVPRDAASRYRNALNLWVYNVRVDNVERVRAAIEESSDPKKVAAAWRGIAWYYVQNDSREEALEAIARGVAITKTIDRPYPRSISFVLLADLYLELGETEQALRLIPDAKSSEANMMPLMRGLTSFTTGPAIIGVLVRAGQVDRVFEMLRSSGSEASSGWMAFGEFCAETGRLDFAARLIDDPLAATSKAWFAAGVADALLLTRTPATKPPVSTDGS